MENNIIEETNTMISDNRINEIAENTNIIMQANLFLVAFIVVLVVCYILWKSLDNFISY